LCSHRFSIKDRVYPAILPVENKTVSGKVGSPSPLYHSRIDYYVCCM
jgi:hypothetical protein